jgi:hypothetical protein
VIEGPQRQKIMHADDVWIPLLIGAVFTALAGFKFYGLTRGILGGARKPNWDRLCAT